MPTISVALATYQGERFLAEQLDSLLRQTRPPDEVVVRDDASTDQTVRLLEAFAERAPFPVHLAHARSNEGPVVAFQHALGRCTGDLIALCDQDDRWRDDKLAVAAGAFEGASSALKLHVSDAELIDGDGQALGVTASELFGLRGRAAARFRADPFQDLLWQACAPGCAMVLSRDVVDASLPFPPSLGLPAHPVLHDRWLAQMAAGLGDVEVDPRRLLDYRRHASQVTNRATGGPRGVRRRPLSELVEPLVGGTSTRVRLEARARQLSELGATLRAAGARDRASVADAAAGHLARRASLPPHRVARLPHIAADLRSGEYAASGGVHVAVVDLLRMLGPLGSPSSDPATPIRA